MLKIGVIGTGHMGRNHVRNLVQEKGFNMVGVFDANPEQAEETSQRYGVKAFDNINNLLDEVDAVTVAAPSSLHKEIALCIAQHGGVHALIEKPLATTSADAKEIVDAFSEKGLKLAVGHIERFNPVFHELQKLVDTRKVYYVEAKRYSPFIESGRISDASVIEDLMIHDVDLVCELMKGKRVTSLHSRVESVVSNQTDFASCLIDFGGKAHAVINASRIAQNKERSIIVHMTDSYIHADMLTRTLEICKSTNLTVDIGKDDSYRQEGIVQKVFVPQDEPLRAELLAFRNAIIKNLPIEVDGQVGINAITICEEVARRAKE